MIFTEEEMRWIYTNRFGWPIKAGCPGDIKKRINEKKLLLDKQRDEIINRGGAKYGG